MKFFDSKSSFPYSWEQVTRANWNKYPNEITTHVETVDVLRREIDPETHILRTERIIGVRQPVPLWLTKLLRTDGRAFCREVSEIDLKKGTLTMRTQNLDHSTVLSVMETIVYQRDPSSPSNNTLFTQRASFHSGINFKKISQSVEDFSLQRFIQNSKLGRAAFDQVLENTQ
ncbi:Ups2 protein [Starmerella bacillaris]|uniref:Ups2 protein n=1 Tax=Starmerella bacillaris TaxID=1247836 RepID=A0AAV5RG84_STABA|nr:Ups2 protein [Starmerella bacillaris]